MAFKTSSFDGDVHGHCITTTLFVAVKALKSNEPFSLSWGLIGCIVDHWKSVFGDFVCRRSTVHLFNADRDGMKVIVFSLIAGTEEIMRVEKHQALVDWVAQFATTRRRALVGTWFSGLTCSLMIMPIPHRVLPCVHYG